MTADVLDQLMSRSRVRWSTYLVSRGHITAVGHERMTWRRPSVSRDRGGALIPGLHDHHIHLLATAAAMTSVDVGPPAVRDAASLAGALRRADRSHPEGAWIRAVGYHESVAGRLDRELLDAIVPHRPLRVQHRGGAMWVLNSTALDVIERAASTWPAEGVERDGSGRPTGRLFRLDRWLRDVLPFEGVPDLGTVGQTAGRLRDHRRHRHDTVRSHRRPASARRRGTRRCVAATGRRNWEPVVGLGAVPRAARGRPREDRSRGPHASAVRRPRRVGSSSPTPVVVQSPCIASRGRRWR